MKKILILSAFVVIAITRLATTANAETKTDADGSVTTTEPSDKYGAGGKHVTKSDKNYKLIVEIYYDKCGRTRESTLPYKTEGHKSIIHTYYDENGKPAVRVIEYPGGADPAYLDLRGGKDSQLIGDAKFAMKPAAGKALVEKLEKTPSAPCPEPPKEQQPKTRPRMPGDAFVPSRTPAPTTGQRGLFEFGIGYNYIYAPEEDVKDLHGFDSSLFVNVNPWLALGGNFMAGFGCTSEEFGGVDFRTSMDRYVYVFGPKITCRAHGNLSLFAKAMVGGVTDVTDVTSRTTNIGSYSTTAFAFMAGGGADLRLNSHWTWRIVEADYLGTNFGNSWQDNMRVTTGIVFTFGGKAPATPAIYSKEARSDAK